jgi:hypothetical protein
MIKRALQYQAVGAGTLATPPRSWRGTAHRFDHHSKDGAALLCPGERQPLPAAGLLPSWTTLGGLEAVSRLRSGARFLSGSGSPGSSPWYILVRAGKGRRREIGMDEWGWEQLRPWPAARAELPVGPLFCVIDGATRGRAWSAAEVRTEFRRLGGRAGVGAGSRRTSCVTRTRSNSPATACRSTSIQRQLGHANLGTTSIYLQGIDPEEIIIAVRARRRAPGLVPCDDADADAETKACWPGRSRRRSPSGERIGRLLWRRTPPEPRLAPGGDPTGPASWTPPVVRPILAGYVERELARCVERERGADPASRACRQPG